LLARQTLPPCDPALAAAALARRRAAVEARLMEAATYRRQQ
jgi:hypothetical protein